MAPNYRAHRIIHISLITYFFQFEDDEVLDLLSLNNTKKAGKQVLFFNRVPKVGSQAFMELLRKLSIKNQFSFNRDRVQRVETIRLAPYEQVLLKNLKFFKLNFFNKQVTIENLF